MTQPGTPGGQIPVRDLDGLARRLRDIEREIALLKANALGRNGITVNNAAGGMLARIGEIFTGLFGLRIRYPSGQTQMLAGEIAPGVVELQLRRSTGSLAFAVGGSAGGHQYAAIYDRTPQAVISDDTISGVGIGVPYIPWGPFVSNAQPTDTTTSGTFVTLQTALGSKMNPKIAMQVMARSDVGTTGEVRVIDEDGTQIGSTITVPAGTWTYYDIAPTALPGAFKEPKSLNLQARRTGGAGSIGVCGISAEGRQS